MKNSFWTPAVRVREVTENWVNEGSSCPFEPSEDWLPKISIGYERVTPELFLIISL